MFSAIPKEIAVGDIYLAPLLVAGFVAVICTSLTFRLLNKLKWYRYVANQSLVELSIVVIYTVLLSTFIFPS